MAPASRYCDRDRTVDDPSRDLTRFHQHRCETPDELDHQQHILEGGRQVDSSPRPQNGYGEHNKCDRNPPLALSSTHRLKILQRLANLDNGTFERLGSYENALNAPDCFCAAISPTSLQPINLKALCKFGNENSRSASLLRFGSVGIGFSASQTVRSPTSPNYETNPISNEYHQLR
jgi:hypothetical protein